jgi:hypothetical protein
MYGFKFTAKKNNQYSLKFYKVGKPKLIVMNL